MSPDESTGEKVAIRERLNMLLVLIALLLCGDAAAAVLHGDVIRLDDGDSLVVRGRDGERIRVRLAGIDAPERLQPWSRRSRQHLASLVLKRRVTVDWIKQDKYGRHVGKVRVGSLDAGLAQIRAGLAWHYRAYENEQTEPDRRLYRQAEATARRLRIGLWQDRDAQPPWEFRRNHPQRAR